MKIKPWFFARILVLVLTIVSFNALTHSRTNFDLVGGIFSGVIIFFVLRAWLEANSVAREEIGLHSPFWPMRKHPLNYWLTIGTSFILASLANLAVAKSQTLIGLMLVGLGMVCSVLSTKAKQVR